MNIRLTAMQELEQKEPTHLDVLHEFDKRKGLKQYPKLKNKLRKLERGYKGEMLLIDYLKKYGESHWVILRNVWLNFFGGFECDVLLITKSGLYPFEVKNYSNTFYLKDNIGKINEIELSKHPVSQGQNAVLSLKAIFKHLPTPPDVIGSVLFIGADSKVDIQDDVLHLNILLRNDLKDFILDIAQKERAYKGPKMNLNKILKTLSQHEIKNQFPAISLYSKLKQQIQSGIICSHCGSFDLEITKTYVTCKCGMHEPRDEAIVRTICEYGVMNFDRNLTMTELVDFFDSQVSRSNVHRVVKQYFDRCGSFRNSQIVNKKRPFSEVYHHFEFQSKKFKVISGPKLE